MFTTVALVSVLASLAVASPVEIAARQAASSTAGTFHICDFYNTGSPHSTLAEVRFNISDSNPTGSVIDNASCQASMSVTPSIATTPNFSIPCSDPSVTFGFQYGPGGYYLTLTHLYNDTAVQVDSAIAFMGDSVETVSDPMVPTGAYQHLVHATDFDIPYFRAGN